MFENSNLRAAEIARRPNVFPVSGTVEKIRVPFSAAGSRSRISSLTSTRNGGKCRRASTMVLKQVNIALAPAALFKCTRKRPGLRVMDRSVIFPEISEKFAIDPGRGRFLGRRLRRSLPGSAGPAAAVWFARNRREPFQHPRKKRFPARGRDIGY